MSPSEAYKILGLREGASEDEIRRAYRDLVKKYHPYQYVNNPLSDLAAEKLKEINEAYDVLMRRDTRYQSAGSPGARSSARPAVIPRLRCGVRRCANPSATTSTLRRLCFEHPLQNAEWFYLNGIIKCAARYDAARDSLGRAASMDPTSVPQRLRNLVRSITPMACSEGGMDMCYLPDPLVPGLLL